MRARGRRSPRVVGVRQVLLAVVELRDELFPDQLSEGARTRRRTTE